MRFSFSLSTCSTSAVSASTSGMPACTRTASWRVAMARSSADTRPSTQRRTFTSRACCAFCCCSPRTSVRKTPSRRSVARSDFGESASRSPCTAFPAAVSALYSNTGMVALVQVLRGHRQHLRRGGEALGHLERAVLEEREHPALHRLPLDGGRVDGLED